MSYLFFLQSWFFLVTYCLAEHFYQAFKSARITHYHIFNYYNLSVKCILNFVCDKAQCKIPENCVKQV